MLFRFLPERWLRTNKEKEEIHPFASLPFGHGPRMCIGKRFAELEMQMLLAKIVANYRIEWAGNDNFYHICKVMNNPNQPIRLRLKGI